MQAKFCKEHIYLFNISSRLFMLPSDLVILLTFIKIWCQSPNLNRLIVYAETISTCVFIFSFQVSFYLNLYILALHLDSCHWMSTKKTFLIRTDHICVILIENVKTIYAYLKYDFTKLLTIPSCKKCGFVSFNIYSLYPHQSLMAFSIYIYIYKHH